MSFATQPNDISPNAKHRQKLFPAASGDSNFMKDLIVCLAKKV